MVLQNAPIGPSASWHPGCLRVDIQRLPGIDAGGPITVAALEAGQVDVALLFSSDAVIAARGFVVLEDDEHLQLADNVAPVIRTQVLNAASSEIRTLTSNVSKILTTEELTGLNRQVGIDRMDPKDAASGWLKAKRLIS